MSSLKQIEANRLNALKSTGPRTDEGKQRSRCNAVRHGLSAETVIADLEDQQDYEAFETAVASCYDVESAVERELVLRLASVLWRLRRAIGIETALFESMDRQSPRSVGKACAEPTQLFSLVGKSERPNSPVTSDAYSVQRSKIADSFLRLIDFPTCPLDRLNRYEQRLWRQARQIILTLKTLTARRAEPRHRSPFPLRRENPLFDDPAS
jgi:hypothetical protein